MNRVLKQQKPGGNGSSAVGILNREELLVTEIRSRLKGRVIIPGDCRWPTSVDAENHPDLFWAIRGGGGNFGVAMRFQFRLHQVGEIMGG